VLFLGESGNYAWDRDLQTHQDSRRYLIEVNLVSEPLRLNLALRFTHRLDVFEADECDLLRYLASKAWV
jgi:hypothetical protein